MGRMEMLEDIETLLVVYTAVNPFKRVKMPLPIVKIATHTTN
jgi:hypothetical protein